MKILITGGAGYIGSTVATACLESGHLPIILDDLSTGAAAFVRDRTFYRGDFADADVLDAIFDDHRDLDAVVHCAAHIIVPESVENPLRYYSNNVAKTIQLLQNLQAHGCERFVFSSSGSVYESAGDAVVDETSPVVQKSPYSRTKLMVEQILRDVADSGALRAMSLRYFNPVGADPELRTGQQLVTHTLVLSKLVEAHESGSEFAVTGTDWPTRDGSAIRDYVHVWDVARAHVRAIEKFDEVMTGDTRYEVFNIGTGQGTTVRELVSLFEQVRGSRLNVAERPARPGDALGCYARVDKAARQLGWRAELTVTDAITDALAWAEIRDEILAG